MNNTPPRWAVKLLRLYCSARFIDELEGDLCELYDRNLAQYGKRKAAQLFIFGVLGSVRLYRIKKLKGLNTNIMLINHFKVAFRHSLRHRVFTAVNLLSLFFGIASVFYIGLYVKNETSYDQFHEKKDVIYRVLRTDPVDPSTAALSSQFGKVLSSEFPGIKICSMGSDPVKIGDIDPILVEDFYWTDSTFFDLFSFNLIHGDPKTALSDPSGLVLTQSLSQKLFGVENPLNKVVTVKIYDSNEKMNMKVTGVVADPPQHSHIQFSGLGSMAVADKMYASLASHWGFSWVRTYALIPDLAHSGIREQKPAIIEKYLGKDMVERLGMDFQPMQDVYLYSKNMGGNELAGDIGNIIIFSTIGFFILLIAVLNYVNLSTARALSRAKEIGLRKTIGAGRADLIAQILVESVFYTLVASTFAIALIIIALPFLNSWMSLQLSASVFGFREVIWSAIGIVAIGALSGFYPAFVLTRYSPVVALSGHSSGKTSSLPRKVLITIQYCITIFLITGSVVVYLQFQYMKTFDLGFDQKQLINVAVNDRGLQQRIDVLKESFKNIPGVDKAATSGEPLPARMQNTWGFYWQGAEPDTERGIDIVGVDKDYFDVVGLHLTEGATFTLPFEADSGRSVVINEKARDFMGKISALNEVVEIGGKNRKIIGVVEDHHYTSLHSTIAPVAYMVYGPGYRVSPDNVLMRVTTGNLPALLEQLETTWREFSTDPFEMAFVDDAFARTYASEQQFFRVVSAFTAIAIIIALCGVFGLIIFLAESRTKEISIRKVLGASVFQLTYLLSSDFVKLFAVAVLIAGPAVYWFTDNWLSDYPLHIDLSIEVVAISAACCLIISIFIVLTQVFRLTAINPARTLKSE
ncbi:MAG: ABC transporter permease [Imperialibacter sp.]|uniref:ABC transporter permease n=1 Tax=Imperialibacter sp. TaxID=2038411 RepID=UPI003A86B2C3